MPLFTGMTKGKSGKGYAGMAEQRCMEWQRRSTEVTKGGDAWNGQRGDETKSPGEKKRAVYSNSRPKESHKTKEAYCLE
ncbi:hypothetical protein EDM53_03810 [Rickettsiales endosymbiont of Peranema trichophorum]|uniref:hypothetical protein n=1 Tax=Rickettsiales endosymbiont of Peranema trichophorum TaxID=2486577 RepID=UPI001023B72B|nr:hypothetical protein [Rickettsiales endosymbiont of Peranema trichophorum]RZI46711.1 hypothetical protein EDM53_03810 [Rickettsiales endosymbiont of Peranema trichophorum]